MLRVCASHCHQVNTQMAFSELGRQAVVFVLLEEEEMAVYELHTFATSPVTRSRWMVLVVQMSPVKVPAARISASQTCPGHLSHIKTEKRKQAHMRTVLCQTDAYADTCAFVYASYLVYAQNVLKV